MNWAEEIGWFCCRFNALPRDFFALTLPQYRALVAAKAKEASDSNG